MLCHITPLYKTTLILNSNFVYALTLATVLFSLTEPKINSYKNKNVWLLLLLSGLPPLPTFFTKIWVMGYLFSKVTLTLIILIILVNTVLLLTYILYIFRVSQSVYTKTNETVADGCYTNSIPISITFALLTIFVPEFFKIL